MSDTNTTNETAKPISYRAGLSHEELRAKYNISRITKLGSNENPLGPSPRAVEAIRKVAGDVNRYPPMEDSGLRGALAAMLGSGITPDHIVTGNGGVEVLSLLAYAMLDADSECVICRPTFPIYEETAKRQKATAVFADLDPTDFTYDVGAILGSVSDRTRIVYVCNPNNPTGGLCRSEQIQMLLDKLPPHVLLVADEVYHHFVEDDHEANSVTQVVAGRNVLVVHSFSKALGMAGGRLGYAVGQPETIRRISSYRLPFHLNALTLASGLAALEDHDHTERTVAVVRHGRAWISDQLAALGIRVWPSEANFVLFKTDAPGSEVAERLLQRGVIVRALDGFYLPGYLRVSVGQDKDNRHFVDALADVLAELRRSS